MNVWHNEVEPVENWVHLPTYIKMLQNRTGMFTDDSLPNWESSKVNSVHGNRWTEVFWIIEEFFEQNPQHHMVQLTEDNEFNYDVAWDTVFVPWWNNNKYRYEEMILDDMYGE